MKTQVFKTGLMAVTMASALAFSQVGSADIVSYAQNFESVNPASETALSDDGWLVGANVFTSGGDFAYNYFAFPAPNVTGGGPAFSGVATGEGGASQGANQLNTYNDYDNQDHFNGSGNVISANLFRDVGIIGAGDVGKTFTFGYDVKQGNQVAPSTSLAFLKALKTSDGSFAELGFGSTDTTGSGSNWSAGSASLTIDAAWVGETLQMGFVNNASNGDASGVFYDNLNVSAVPIPAAAWLFGSALMGLVGVSRRRKA